MAHGLTRRLIFVVSLAFLPAPLMGAGSSAANGEQEAVNFLREYLLVARSGPGWALVPLVSRSILEEGLEAVMTPPDDGGVLRNAKLSLGNYRLLGGSYCLVDVINVTIREDKTVVRAVFRRPDNPEIEPLGYDISLVREKGRLRLDNEIIAIDQLEGPHGTPAIDLCNEPLDHLNPAALLPEEGIEDQRKRLGIPPAGKICQLICAE